MGEGTRAGATLKRGIARPATPRIRSAVAIAALWALAVPGAAQAFTEGPSNNFFGSDAGAANTTGLSNSFFGGDAGESNTTGDANSFFGRFAGAANTTSTSNSFFGRGAGGANTTGGFNSFFGRDAGLSNTDSFFNSFFGRGAGLFNTTGADNTFLGDSAGDGNTTGSQNTALGREADVTGGVSDATAVGHRALVGQANSLVLGAIDGVNDATADTSVGIGTTAPSAPLHVESDNPTGAAGNELLKLEQSNTGTVQDRALMLLQNNGGTRFQFDNTDTGNSWRYQAGTGGADNFEVTKVGTGEIEMTLGPSGDLDIAGTVSQGSDRADKRDLEPVRGRALLRSLRKLAISEWTYKRDRTEARHLGPMAQDFHSAFGLGSDRTKVAPGDMAGVALAGLKAQQRVIERQRSVNERQGAEIRKLRKQVRAILAERD